MKILAVDDSPTMLEILVSTLEESHCTVCKATNGAEAMALLESEDVDVIISDVNMVVMSGFELLHKVRHSARHRTTPFVLLTTETDSELKRIARANGATAWMVKPFDPATLVKFIRQLVLR